MPNPIGVIIDPPNNGTGGGIPAIVIDSGGSNPNQQSPNNAGNEPPEVINGFETIDPETIRIEPTAKRKPGRPKGSGNRSTAGIGTGTSQKTPDSLIDLSVLLVSLHQMGAALCGVEELELDKSEADTYADAIKELAKHYPHNVNPKALAWMNFACVVGGIYGTRFQAYRMRIKKEQSTPAGGRVVEMKPAATGTNGAPPPPTKPAAKPSADPFAGLLTPSQLWNEPPVTGGGEF